MGRFGLPLYGKSDYMAAASAIHLHMSTPFTLSPPHPPLVPMAGVPHLSDIVHASPTRLFAFEQMVPIPPYLLALAVGQLESRELSARCGDKGEWGERMGG